MSIHKIYKTDNIIKVTPDDTLAHALSLLASSHDSAFVVDNNQLLGIINPYYCIIKKSYPANTKTKHCLIHPPFIDIDFPMQKVIQFMIDTKLHYLPVFSNDNFYGIISARRILSSIKDAPELKIRIDTYLRKKQPVISLYEKDTLSHAVSLFKKHKISKLIVLSSELKLKGILAYYDLIAYLTTSQNSKKNRLKDGKKPPLMNQYVKNFMKTNVLTLTPENTLSDAVNMILEKKIGSTIIIDSQRHPIGIITTRDLISVYSGYKDSSPVEIVTKQLSENSRKIVQPFIKQVATRFIKHNNDHHAQDKMRIVVQEKGQGGVFKAMVSIVSRNHVTVIKKEGKNLLKVLNSIREKIKR
ncbi:MAG TPA: CBS domain-containing protein [Candidatus Nitrosocosmicus sp.]|nr:CBS domain-containing protein [Candidatus Nitrosocosmicus sp.]